MHVHVQREKNDLQVLDPACGSGKESGFAAKELNTLREIITRNRDRIVEAWYEHCGASTGSEN